MSLSHSFTQLTSQQDCVSQIKSKLVLKPHLVFNSFSIAQCLLFK